MPIPMTVPEGFSLVYWRVAKNNGEIGADFAFMPSDEDTEQSSFFRWLSLPTIKRYFIAIPQNPAKVSQQKESEQYILALTKIGEATLARKALPTTQASIIAVRPNRRSAIPKPVPMKPSRN